MLKDESQISRQARWQRKHRAMGLCVLCSRPAFKGWRCKKHYEQHKITMRLRYIPRVRGRYKVADTSSAASAKKKVATKAAAKKTATTGRRVTAKKKTASKRSAAAKKRTARGRGAGVASKPAAAKKAAVAKKSGTTARKASRRRSRPRKAAKS